MSSRLSTPDIENHLDTSQVTEEEKNKSPTMSTPVSTPDIEELLENHLDTSKVIKEEKTRSPIMSTLLSTPDIENHLDTSQMTKKEKNKSPVMSTLVSTHDIEYLGTFGRKSPISSTQIMSIPDKNKVHKTFFFFGKPLGISFDIF